MSKAAVSVIITTYNRPDALRCVLEGLLTQDRRDFECIVADDGSGPETAALVESFQQRFAAAGITRLQWVWHEDKGFRLAAIRNRATEAARGTWIVFIDGDCVPQKRFVSGQLQSARSGYVSRGSRILVTKAATEEMMRAGTLPPSFDLTTLVRLRLQGKTNRVVPAVGGPLDICRRAWSLMGADRWQAVRGCNIAISRAELHRLGGFDERFTSWGLEDSEFSVRAHNAGMRVIRACASTTVLHLWHKEGRGMIAQSNHTLLNETIAQRITRTEHGLRCDHERQSPPCVKQIPDCPLRSSRQ
jgi:glycosyltransferase involved in cell wall biosynthesis